MYLCFRNRCVGLGILFCVGAALLLPAPVAAQEVRIWEEDLVLPTYATGPPSIFPIFYDGRAYQGAQGRIYPYAFSDKLTDERRDAAHKAVFLENRYIKLCVLPGLGGRIFSARDKTNGYDLFYRQTVVKPALIGMLGAWWSGGVEWNVPHHHRATSFMPVDYRLEENADGSRTVWIGELELRHRMTWAIGLTLFPDSSRIESRVRIMNRTPYSHSLLFWANVAVHTNEDYQVIFPPGTEYATYHGKNQFVHWPLARESYNRVDYAEGVDISWWKNHPAPTSFFAWNHEDDFLAGYDHGKKAGVVHVADHHVMPGKKFWTWGTAAQGRRWDTILSDEDGPYLELMVGAFSDNQPDYSWIEPFETRSVTHTWYPIRELGGVKSANLEAALNLDVSGTTAGIGINVSQPLEDAWAALWAGGQEVWKQGLELSPDRPFFGEIELDAGTDPGDLRLVLGSGERVVLSYTPRAPRGDPRPQEVVPPAAPEAVKTNEELYLAGLRLEQFHNPTRDPIAYYEEALKRDPGDARVNTRLGIHYLERGLAEEAEVFLQRAASRLGWNHTRPKDNEALYYLGQVQRQRGRGAEAVETLERAAWDPAWRTAACTSLAQMACAQGRFAEALVYLDRAGSAGETAGAIQAPLRAAVLRHLGRFGEASEAASAALGFNPLDFWAAHEQALAENAGGDRAVGEGLFLRLVELMRGEPQSWLELAASYMGCGLYTEAKQALLRFEETSRGDSAGRGGAAGKEIPPLMCYTLGYLEQETGNAAAARKRYAQAAQGSPDGSFPFRAETVRVLEAALAAEPTDSRAHYYLGTCLFEPHPERAIEHWEKARELGEDYFMLFRNLGLAYARVRNDIQTAVNYLEEALKREKGYARLFYELDLMYAAAGKSPAARLALLEANHEIVSQRDDALTQEIKLLVQTGDYDRAISLMSGHHFHVWEGGGQIHSYFVHANLLQGCAALAAGDGAEALEAFRRAGTYPLNLEVGEPYHGGRKTQVRYFEGTAWEAQGRREEAVRAFEEAADHAGEWSELSFYQGMALQRLGRGREARDVFLGLAKAAGQRLGTARGMDFFTKFGERQSAAARQAQAHYLLGLANLGLGRDAESLEALTQAVELDPGHFWALYYLNAIRR